MPQITVEFFGIPRQRAGVETCAANGATLGELLLDLAGRLPELAAACFDGPRLRPGYVANVGGVRFVSDPQTPLCDGDAVLLLSADAGG